MAFFAAPEAGASLILSFRPTNQLVVIVGTGRLAASRALSVLEAGAKPVIIASRSLAHSKHHKNGISSIDVDSAELRWRIEAGQCELRACPDELDAGIANDEDPTLRAAKLEVQWQDLLDDIDGRDRSIFAVCVTDTLHSGVASSSRSDLGSLNSSRRIQTARIIHRLCRSRRIPVNIADQPDICDFSFPAAHRFSLQAARSPQDVDVIGTNAVPEDNTSIRRRASALQIAVTTNGQGCRLAGRIRREIVSMLPRNVGDAVDHIGQLRHLARMEADCVGRRPQKSGNPAGFTADREGGMGSPPLGDEEDDHSFYSTPLNSPVPSTSLQSMKHYFDDPKGLIRQGQSRAIAEEERKRRMRWVAQMSEYWPIDYIGAMSRKDMLQALEHFKDETPSSSNDLEFKDASLTSQQVSAVRGRSRPEECNAEQVNLVTTAGRRTPSQHNLELRAPMKDPTRSGQIILIGSGPGHPGLLTAMALRILTSQQTDLVLSDKLVPASILSLIDPSTTLHIARKFPGNAEGAQSELISLAIEAALQGKTVVRLKQGDPFIYGRGGEEVLAFKQRGLAVSVVPGISSAIAAPLLLGMPVTQRGAADTLILCTGVGRGGKQVGLPGYERGRSLVILMGVARIGDVIKTLCHGWSSQIGAPHRLEDGETQAKVTGIRSGDPYPPYLPIAVIERASSSDQRSISSTLDRIEEAIQDCGEQRPPGMMLVGWAVLALEGGPKGNVDILDEGSALSDDPNELERRDRQRVDRWLGSSKYLVKEGLDEFYSKDSVHAFTARSSKDVNQPNEQHTRSHEWAPPRYGTHGGLYGGWTPGESGLTGSQQQHC